ncbi:MAG TPA: TolC family outer membrane protein [Burkholderiaceae bacterium]
MPSLRPGPVPRIAALRPLACALALAAAGSAAHAQSLAEVIDAARGYDATYLGARANLDAVQYHYQGSLALHRPSVSAQLQGTRNDQHAPYLAAEGSPTATRADLGSAQLAASQSIYNRQNDVTIEQAHKRVELAQSQLQQAEQDLIVRVSQAYFNVLSAADALQTVQANGKAIQEQLASAKRNFEVGNATITDTREAEARADLARSNEIAARNDLQVAHVTLDQLVGRTGVMPHPLALPTTLPPVMPSQASDWVSMAESESPALKQAQLARDIADLETDKAKAGYLPTVSATASYAKNYEHDRFDIGGRTLTAGGWGNTGNVQLTVSVPLYAGGAIQNRLRETVAQQEKARTDAEGARNAATLATRQAFLGAQSQNAQVKALEAAEASSKLALDATMLGYKVGVKVNLDVLNAQSQLYQTERDLAAARYNYLVSGLKLRQAAGTLTANDVLPIDALLTK